MRWITGSGRPKSGTERVREFFALVPVTVGKENRWLERVKVREVYRCDPYGATPGTWEAVEFLDD